MRRPRPLLPAVYRMLLQLSHMRRDVAGLERDLSNAEATRLIAQIDVAERSALRLLDSIESGRQPFLEH